MEIEIKNRMKENVSNAYLGDPVFIIPERSSMESSFSKPIQEFDEYPCSKELIGETDPDVQAMGMRAADVYKNLKLEEGELKNE